MTPTRRTKHRTVTLCGVFFGNRLVAAMRNETVARFFWTSKYRYRPVLVTYPAPAPKRRTQGSRK